MIVPVVKKERDAFQDALSPHRGPLAHYDPYDPARWHSSDASAKLLDLPTHKTIRDSVSSS